MIYRAEIDGLRALAVVPVIFYHAGFQVFSGGYIGVDVFFVISGYLITSIILGDLSLGNFSVVKFYERRARRILPALFFILLICLPFAWILLTPFEFRDFSQSLVAVATFTSNILFWKESGYFDTAVELKPLIHTWSLAVEEQYYIFFPWLLILLWTFCKRWTVVILFLLFLASLVFSHVGAFNFPDASFYFLPSRFWELLLGGFIAIGLDKKISSLPSSILQSGSVAGLLLVLISVFTFTRQTPFPSLYTLAPTVGTLLIIVCAVEGTWVNYLLSRKSIVAVGLVSYSAYLWHQPLLAFTRLAMVNPPQLLLLGLCLITFPLAYLSWRFIEQPFRSKSFMQQPAIFKLGGAFAICFVIIGLLGNSYILRNPRFPEEWLTTSVYGGAGVTNIRLIQNRNDEFILYGDSHAKQYYKALQEKLGNGSLISQPGCLSLPGIISMNDDLPSGVTNCTKILGNFLDETNIRKPKTVFIAYRWERELFSTETGDAIGKLNTPGGMNALENALDMLAEEIPDGTTIYIIGNVPGAITEDPAMHSGYIRCMYYLDAECPSTMNKSLGMSADINRFLSNYIIGRNLPSVKFINPYNYLCEENECLAKTDDGIVYWDGTHLSIYGSKLVINRAFN